MSSIRIKEIAPLNAVLNVLSSGTVAINNATAATNTNASLNVSGGVTILGAGSGSSLTSPDGLYVAAGAGVNGNMFIGGSAYFQNTTTTTDTSTGSCIVSGGLLVKDKLAFQHTYGTLVKYESSTSRPDVTISSFSEATAPSGISLNICNLTSNGTFSSGLRLWATGLNTSAANQEFIEFSYSPSLSGYSLISNAVGSGALKPIKISSTSGISDQVSINTNQTVTFNATQVTALGTNDSTSSTTGSVIVSGGLTVRKGIYANTLTLDGNTEQKLNQQSIAIANNQAAAATIFALTNSKCFKCIAIVEVARTSGGSLFETFDIVGYYQNTSGWSLIYSSQGDITGLTFSIVGGSGTLQYTTPSIANFSAGTLHYKIYTISPGVTF